MVVDLSALVSSCLFAIDSFVCGCCVMVVLVLVLVFLFGDCLLTIVGGGFVVLTLVNSVVLFLLLRSVTWLFRDYFIVIGWFDCGFVCFLLLC